MDVSSSKLSSDAILQMLERTSRCLAVGTLFVLSISLVSPVSLI